MPFAESGVLDSWIAGYPRHLIVVTYLVEDWGSLGENQPKKRAAKFARDIKVTTR